MGVSYDPKHGIQQIDHNCGAKVGYHVTAYGKSYVVECIDDYGCYVCRNLDESCIACDDLRTFDDLDIDSAHPPIIGYGEGI